MRPTDRHTERRTANRGTDHARDERPPVSGDAVGAFVSFLLSLLFLSVAFAAVPTAEPPSGGWTVTALFVALGALTAGAGMYAETERRAR